MASAPQLLRVLSDNSSLHIFNWVSQDGVKSEFIIKRLNLTPKQYYSRLSALKNSGVIEKKKAKYVLTSLGAVVREALQLIESGVEYYWKLKAIDSVRFGFSEKERNRIVGQLIDKQELRELVLRSLQRGESKNNSHSV